MNLYKAWSSPTVIVSDGPYGVGGFPGDPPTPDGLAEWYEPHIQEWSRYSTPQTTLWFWGTELSWAGVHPVLDRGGWEYRAANVWNKGLQHIAGNSNTQRLKQLPVVTEICVQYVKRPLFYVDGQTMSMKEWLRYEWMRTGLPLYKANEACGVKNAASRKYLRMDHLWSTSVVAGKDTERGRPRMPARIQKCPAGGLRPFRAGPAHERPGPICVIVYHSWMVRSRASGPSPQVGGG